MALPPTISGGDGPRIAPVPGVDPAAYGVGLARDLETVGRAGMGVALNRIQSQDRHAAADHEIAMIEDRRALQAKLADRASALATGQVELQTHIQDLRANAGPGAAGHEEQVKALVDDWTSKFMGTVDDPRLVNELAPDVARMAGTLKLGAHSFAIEKRADKQVTDYGTMQSTYANNLLTDPSDANLQQALSVSEKTIRAMPIPADKQDELLHGAKKAYKVAGWQGAALINPEGALAALQKGALNDVAEGNELIQLRSFAETEINRRRIAAEHVQATSLAAVKDEATTLMQQVERGGVVDPARLTALAGTVETHGDRSMGDRLRAAAATAAVTTKLANASPAQITTEIANVEADKDWRTKPAAVALHNALDTMRTERRNAEPNVPAPNWTDPDDVDRYEGQVRAWAAASGIPRPKYLTKDVEAVLKSDLDSGPQGRARVLDVIGRMSPQGAFAAAQQLDPNDRVFQLAATLPDRDSRVLALSGREAAAANADLAPRARVQSYVAREASPALRGFGGDFQRAAEEGTAAIAAGLLARQSKTRWDSDVAEDALHRALGGHVERGRKIGGLGAWNGRPLLLPTRLTQEAFDLKLARMHGQVNGFAGGGEQLDWNMLRKSFAPVAVGDGVYQFRDAYDRPVRAKNGTPALWTVR